MRRRILVITPDFPPATGGIQRLLGELVVHATSWDTLVVTLGGPELWPEPEHSEVNRVTIPPALRRVGIVGLNAVAVAAGRRFRPHAILCAHLVVSAGAHVLGRLTGAPVVQYVYAKEITDRPRLARFALRSCDAAIAISRHTAELAIAAGAEPSMLRIITPGVSLPPIPQSPTPKASRPTILTVARLTDRYKGFDVMLRAMPLIRARVPDAQWVMIGDGPLRAELERAATQWGLDDAAHFLGSVPAAERDGWFDRAHVFAMLSRLPVDGGGEGYGLVYLEAGARGLPCVAGDRGATTEAVVEGQTGLLADATDHVAVADAVTRLLVDPALAEELGAAGRLRSQALSWEQMAREVEALVCQLIARPS